MFRLATSDLENNLASFCSVYFETPVFGDHVLVITELRLRAVTNVKNSSLCRKWSDYTPKKLNSFLYPMIISECSLLINCSVQSYWNLLENLLITVTDLLAPLVENVAKNLDKNKNKVVPPFVNSKINKRNRLLYLDRL